MSSDALEMALTSIDAKGLEEVEVVGEDFGIGILTCVLRCCRVSEGGEDEEKKTLHSWWGYGRIRDSQEVPRRFVERLAGPRVVNCNGAVPNSLKCCECDAKRKNPLCSIDNDGKEDAGNRPDENRKVSDTLSFPDSLLAVLRALVEWESEALKTATVRCSLLTTEDNAVVVSLHDESSNGPPLFCRVCKSRRRASF